MTLNILFHLCELSVPRHHRSCLFGSMTWYKKSEATSQADEHLEVLLGKEKQFSHLVPLLTGLVGSFLSVLLSPCNIWYSDKIPHVTNRGEVEDIFPRGPIKEGDLSVATTTPPHFVWLWKEISQGPHSLSLNEQQTAVWLSHRCPLFLASVRMQVGNGYLKGERMGIYIHIFIYIFICIYSIYSIYIHI